MGIDPETHRPRTNLNHLMNLFPLLGKSNLGTSMSSWTNPTGLQADVTQLAKLQVLQNMLQLMNNTSLINMTNPFLVDNQILNPPLDTFLNGRKTFQVRDPMFRGPEYPNPPALVASCPRTTTFNKMESNYNAAQKSTQSPLSTTFEACEKFLIDDDDDTSGSYWKEILEYCSSRENLTIDHVVPAALGGEWTWENLAR
ncbi:hypothetical protein VNO80_25261 [Phaseolus coccineus]|uniref:HNH nuclease domain-containing protein n=1 Tax=Phaseolus coccineus TaxID=3886 RepID=A0AAN9LY95_PHACN